MLTPSEVYPLVLIWLQALEVRGDANALRALARLVTALLAGQSLRPSALLRALLSPSPVPARQGYKRVARAWDRPWLTPAWLTPHLVRAALALVPAEERGPNRGLTHLALDSVRCGPWEVFVLGVVWHGRVLPLAWRVLAYPWPSGQVGPAVQALLEQVAACWPVQERPVHLVADRAFPSQRLFRTLGRLGWGWTVRLRANTGVQAGAEALLVRDLLRRARLEGWTCRGGSYGRGSKAVAATLVVGRGLVVVPRHRRTAASQRQPARRRAERLRTRRYRYASVDQTDPWVVLCTSHAGWPAAVASYKRRWAIEGSFRDAQSGWDGRHGWDLEPVLTKQGSAAHVERIVGLWALGGLLQTYVGSQVAHGPARVRAIAAGWATTGRLSLWAQGRFALAEPNGHLRDWLRTILLEGAARLAATPSVSARQGPPQALPHAA
jgi:hypothetical protein